MVRVTEWTPSHPMSTSPAARDPSSNLALTPDPFTSAATSRLPNSRHTPLRAASSWSARCRWRSSDGMTPSVFTIARTDGHRSETLARSAEQHGAAGGESGLQHRPVRINRAEGIETVGRNRQIRTGILRRRTVGVVDRGVDSGALQSHRGHRSADAGADDHRFHSRPPGCVNVTL